MVAVLMLVSRLGFAEEKDPATAEALFRAGRDAVDHGDAARACERFEESYRLDPAVGTLLNIADCEVALKRLADAWEHYHRVADALDATDPRTPLVQTRLESLGPRLPKLVLSIRKGAPPSTTVARDGVRITAASFELPLPVNPGHHELVVIASDHASRRYEVVLAEGETRRLALEPGPVVHPKSVPAAAPEHQTRPSFGARRTIAFVALGTAGASLLATGLFAWRYAAEKSSADEHCPGHACDDDGLRSVGAAEFARIGMVVAASASAAFAAVGLTLLWTEPSEASGNQVALPSGIRWQTAF